jgi:histone acetyltransferase (RNA polymerase elongator complex component)
MMSLKNYKKFYAGSLTNIPENQIEKFLTEAEQKRKNKRVDKIHISISPKRVSKELIIQLKKYNVILVELEVKIANDFILKKCKFDFDNEDIKKASKLIKKSKLQLGYQLMIGLPDSTKIDEEESAKRLIKYKPTLVRIYPVLVLKETEIEKAYKNEEYEPLNLQQAIERCKDVIYVFNRKKIKAITIGTLNGNTLSKNDNLRIIAGPVHKAFPDLVEDSIWYDSIVGKIKKISSKVKEVKIEVHPSNVNNVIGYEKENEKKIKEIYAVDIQVTPNDKIKPGRSEMKILTVYED